ncbi:MAG: alpha/beta hydrolase [Lachnospiraceae bacterium]|nr:alpha/beta hydrolase [Lachnospiraceae bacterium]
MGRKIKNGCIAIGDTDMYYAAFGTGEKVLVVLPGLSDGLATVKGKAFLLAAPYQKHLKDYTVYMFSRKNKMPEGYTISDMADDQAAVMKSLGIRGACICGVSQGGMIAQSIAINHPEMVSKLVLAVTAPYANDVVKNAVTSWIEMAKRGDHTALMTDAAEKMYSRKYLNRNRNLFPLLARFTKPADYERFFRNAYAILDFDVREELSKITAPTLIIAGSDDKTVGNDAARELKAGIDGSELIVYEGLGHGAYEEAGDFYERIFAFFARR